MTKLVSIFIFAVAVFIGVFALPADTPTIYEKIYPSFSQAEANLLLGKRVKNKKLGAGFVGNGFVGMKYSLGAEKEKFVVEKNQIGETGTIVNISKTPQGFFLVVKWDAPNKYGDEMFSYDGRFSSRVFLDFE